MDLLYTYKANADDFEIRYSLRSFLENAPFVRKVWIYGDRPRFLIDDTSLVEQVPLTFAANIVGATPPIRNTFLMLFLSSLIPELTPEYVWCSDDFFLLKEYPAEEARKNRYLENLVDVKVRGRGLWKDQLWRTCDLLVQRGYPAYNFETHTPTYLTKKRVLNAYCEFRDLVTEDRAYGLMGPTAIGNHALKHENFEIVDIVKEGTRGGFYGNPPESQEALVQAIAGKTFFNCDDAALDDTVRRYLMDRFPRPSRLEREG